MKSYLVYKKTRNDLDKELVLATINKREAQEIVAAICESVPNKENALQCNRKDLEFYILWESGRTYKAWTDVIDIQTNSVEPCIHTIKENDALLEKLWHEFGDVPMDPETECIEEPFLCFPVGTFREDIWHWFDERYSKGVAHLMYLGGVDRTDQIAKITYLIEMCDDCESKHCAYYHEGICRFALVHERRPKMADEDRCLEFVIDCL